jgi:hypothetical protein
MGPIRKSLSFCDSGPAQGSAEATPLDRYAVGESPLKHFVARSAERAPWWTISLLVHAIALFVAWSFPYRRPAQETRLEYPPVRLLRTTPREPPPREPLVRPPLDPPELPDDFVIVRRPVELPEPKGEPDVQMQAPAPPSLEPPPPPMSEPPARLIALDVDAAPLRVVNPYRRRDSLYRPLVKGPPRGRHGPDDVLIARLVDPIKAGLIWLAKAQEPDGSWNAHAWEATNEYRVGMTGLALLAFQGAGLTHRRGPFRATLGAALGWLRAHQRDDGSFPFETFYEQGIATMAVTEAYGMTRDEALRPLAQRAIDYIVAIQPDHGGYRYRGAAPRDQGDVSVTGWQIMALKSAATAGLKVPPRAFERARKFLAGSWRDYGSSAYLVGDARSGSLAVSAIGLLCRVFLNDQGSYADEIGVAADFLHGKETVELRPVPGGASRQLVHDLYYTYYSSLAMFQLGGEYWGAWNAMYIDPLLDAQVHQRVDRGGRYVKGSWGPAGHKWGKQGGRVYATALALLSLEAPFRFLPVLRQRS